MGHHEVEARALLSAMRKAVDRAQDDFEHLLMKNAALEADLQKERARVIELEREVQRLESEVQG